ncbi:hypothetical protein [Acinetobacter sp. YH12112]|uniref:hypothetical protein n=1 Tax=Acinetobacter sp. YH12112 TaxID=2601099 RepID=UPI0015D2F99E|nr:hypothetical protein [Acinetobacter sp. YH12112]
MSITNELLAHMSYTAVVQKNSLREQLDTELAEFLAKGGEIKQLEGTEIKPLPPRSTAGADNYASVMQVGALIDWCKKGSPRRSRRAAIMERTGLSKRRVFTCLTPNATSRLTKHEYARIKAVLKDIEEAEMEWGVEA